MAEEKEALSGPTPSRPPGVSLPQEAPPPSYESLNLSYLKNTTPDTWRKPSALSQQPISLSDTPTSTLIPNANLNANVNALQRHAPPAQPFRPPNPKGHQRSLSSSSASSLKSKKSWFNFTSSSSSSTTSTGTGASGVPVPSSTSSKQANEVRSTVCGLVRNLVVGSEGSSSTSSLSSLSYSPATDGILQSCAEVCMAHRMSFSAILQDKFVESHSPLYWAIVKRPSTLPNVKTTPSSSSGDVEHILDQEDIVNEPESTEMEGEAEDEADLLGALLSHCRSVASPLSPETIIELRQACLATSDQATFQRLRLTIPEFSQTSGGAGGADRVLLGGTGIAAKDEVSVDIHVGERSGAQEGAFSVVMGIPQFHKRMMVSREVGLEFVARNRIWRLAFLITPDDAPSWSGPPPGSWCISLSLQEPSPPTWFDGRLILLPPTKVNPVTDVTSESTASTIRIKTKHMLEAPKPPKPNAIGGGGGTTGTKVTVQMDENSAFAVLQYSGSPYIQPDSQKLAVKLEARLRKPALGDFDDGMW